MCSSGVHIGEYIVLQSINDGAFGRVKLARHKTTGQKVAIKILNRQQSSESRGFDWSREVLILKELGCHPNITSLYEVLDGHTNIYIFMEYVAGGELFDYIVHKGRLTEAEAARLFVQLMSGIRHCHRRMVCHRDLKAENILLGKDGTLKIADFGLSAFMHDGNYLSASCGSLNYAAPEVLHGRAYCGPEVDVWSAGVILYAMLCGRLPFDDEHIYNLRAKVQQGHFQLPGHLSSHARRLLVRILLVDSALRISVDEILKHPWLRTTLSHDPGGSPTGTTPFFYIHHYPIRSPWDDEDPHQLPDLSIIDHLRSIGYEVDDESIFTKKYGTIFLPKAVVAYRFLEDQCRRCGPPNPFQRRLAARRYRNHPTVNLPTGFLPSRVPAMMNYFARSTTVAVGALNRISGQTDDAAAEHPARYVGGEKAADTDGGRPSSNLSSQSGAESSRSGDSSARCHGSSGPTRSSQGSIGACTPRKGGQLGRMESLLSNATTAATLAGPGAANAAERKETANASTMSVASEEAAAFSATLRKRRCAAQIFHGDATPFGHFLPGQDDVLAAGEELPEREVQVGNSFEDYVCSGADIGAALKTLSDDPPATRRHPDDLTQAPQWQFALNAHIEGSHLISAAYYALYVLGYEWSAKTKYSIYAKKKQAPGGRADDGSPPPYILLIEVFSKASSGASSCIHIRVIDGAEIAGLRASVELYIAIYRTVARHQMAFALRHGHHHASGGAAALATLNGKFRALSAGELSPSSPGRTAI